MRRRYSHFLRANHRVAPAQGFGPEAILRLPPQIQEQVRRAER